jgi:hypothetical protein
MSVEALPTLDATQRYALLVGIGKYPRPEYALPSPSSDVATLRSVLIGRYGFLPSHILTLSDQSATRDNIIAGLRTHLGQAGPNGLALFYFVGHGLALDRNYSAQDAEPSGHDQALFVWGPNGRGTIVLDDELNVLLRQLPTKRVVAMLDACYAGSGAQFMAKVLGTLDSKAPRPAAHIMSVSFAGPGDPADIPSHFVSDGQVVEPNDSMSLVVLGASEENRRAYSVDHWPTPNQARSMFGYYLDSILDRGTNGGTASFSSVNGAIAEGIRKAALCADWGKCQVPQIRGRLADVPVGVILGTPH